MSDSLKCPLCQYTNTSLAKECEICGTLLTLASLPNKSHDSKKKIRQAMPVVGKESSPPSKGGACALRKILLIRDIYQGRVKNWQELGGVDLPITPISLDNEVDRLTGLLNISQIDNDVLIARDYTTAIRETSSTEGAISYGSSAIVKGQGSIRPIAVAKDDESPPISALLADGTVNLQAFSNNLYPLTRRLFVVIRRDETRSQKAGVAYTNFLLSEEGQKIVKQAGFVPL
jgi:ABC-type phosphate transport system substrate-binding protein